MTWRMAIAAVVAAVLVAPSAGAQPGAPYDCVLEPRVVVAVGASVDGLIESMTVDRGDLVKKGQPIAQLEASSERAAVASARARAEIESTTKGNQARLEFGVRRFVRTEELFKKELVPVKEMDEAETQKVLAEIGVLEGEENKRISELDLERARVALAQKTIVAPVSGVVTERLLSPGELVKQTALLKIAQIDPLRVEVIVPVAMLGKIRLGMRAQIAPEVPIGKEAVIARVTVVDRVADAASGTFGVRLEIPNPDYRLPSGLKCKARFLD